MNLSITDRAIKSVGKHPYLWTFLFCLLINPFYLGAAGNIPNNALMIETFILVVGIAAICYHLFVKGTFSKKKGIITCAVLEAVSLVCVFFYSRSDNKGFWLFSFGCVAIVTFSYFAKTKKYKAQLNSLVIIGISFCVKFYYVLYTSVYTRQHDIKLFGGEIGHAGYIEYILFNHHLPDFDVREVWQYCHPPLHHTICAIWIGVSENIFGVGHDAARESLQTLTLFYSMCIVITAYKIFRHFKLKGVALLVPTALVAFHPTFILLSGSINNDVLSIAFMMGAFLCTLKWYENQTFKNILKIALCVGLGMMTKLSAALVAPPIAIVFLIVFIKKIKTDWKKMIGQFAAFGAVCVPLGLWFEIRNYINYKVPFNYVQQMSTSENQYIGNQKFIDRIFDFSPNQLSSVFEQWVGTNDAGVKTGYNEYNPIIALLKNSVFGESVNQYSFEEHSYMLAICTLFFYVALVIAVIAFACMIIMSIKKSVFKPVHKIFFISFYVVLMFSIYKMSHDFPFTCTMNFRYITPTVIIGAMFIGLVLDKISASYSSLAKSTVKAAVFGTTLFALLSSVLYITVAPL